MQSYIIATHLLRQAGLQAGDYEYEFTKNPPNAILAPYYGQAAAGGVGDKVLKLPVITGKIDITEMTYLAVGEQLPHLPWAVAESMPLTLSNQVQAILASLDKSDAGRAVLRQATLTG